MSDLTTCIGPECSRPATLKWAGLCAGHDSQRRAGKNLTPIKARRKRSPNAVCATDSCESLTRARGYCFTCYHRHRVNGTLEGYLPRGSTALRDDRGRKRCTTCAVWKTEGEVRSNRGAKDGLQNACADCVRERRSARTRERLYGISSDDYEAMMEAQGGACLICGDNSPFNWSVDHDHSCCAGEATCGACVRAILCGHCNIALGYIRDNADTARSMAKYLDAMEVA